MFGGLIVYVYDYIDVYYVPQQLLKYTAISQRGSTNPHSSREPKKIIKKTRFTAKLKYSLQESLTRCLHSFSLSPLGALAALRKAGTC